MSLEISEPRPGVTLVILSNIGKRNAIDEPMFRELAELWPRLEASSTRCIVVAGAGGHFSSGADLSGSLASLADVDFLIDAGLLKTRIFPKPIVAAIEGVCVAGGLELAMSCDVRLCAPDCRFGFPEVRWGIFPAGGAALRLAGEIGYAAAAELLLTGRFFDSAEALRLGLVNRIVEKQAILEEALDVAGKIAANSPTAVAAIRTYLAEARSPGRRLMRLEQQLARRTRASDDAREGNAAFLEKRAPAYSDPEPHGG